MPFLCDISEILQHIYQHQHFVARALCNAQESFVVVLILSSSLSFRYIQRYSCCCSSYLTSQAILFVFRKLPAQLIYFLCHVVGRFIRLQPFEAIFLHAFSLLITDFLIPAPCQAPLLPKLRGHFAEFLNKGSLVRLRILSSPTCVGLRYGHPSAPSSFSRQREFISFPTIFGPLHSPALRQAYFTACQPHCLDALYHQRALTILLCHCFVLTLKVVLESLPVVHRLRLYRPRLRPRLTLRGRTFLRKP